MRRQQHENHEYGMIDPKRKCCMMGSFERTSSSNFFNIPEVIFCHDAAALMLNRSGECS